MVNLSKNGTELISMAPQGRKRQEAGSSFGGKAERREDKLGWMKGPAQAELGRATRPRPCLPPLQGTEGWGTPCRGWCRQKNWTCGRATRPTRLLVCSG